MIPLTPARALASINASMARRKQQQEAITAHRWPSSHRAPMVEPKAKRHPGFHVVFALRSINFLRCGLFFILACLAVHWQSNVRLEVTISLTTCCRFFLASTPWQSTRTPLPNINSPQVPWLLFRHREHPSPHLSSRSSSLLWSRGA